MATPLSGGPYLLVACICENVVERRDAVLTLVNIVDRVTFAVQSERPPETMPPVDWKGNLVVIMKAGRARGRHELRVTPELPGGGSLRSAAMSIFFEGADDRGVQVIMPLHMSLDQEGLYWFNLELDGEEITRLPLRTVYTRVTAGEPPVRPPT